MSKNATAATVPAADVDSREAPVTDAERLFGAMAAAAPSDLLTLDLADLVHDSNGEIVLFNDSHLPALAVRAPSQPVESGAVGRHVTAAGDDVTGYRFVAFDDGTKLFYQESLDLLVVDNNS